MVEWIAVVVEVQQAEPASEGSQEVEEKQVVASVNRLAFGSCLYSSEKSSASNRLPY